MLRFHIQNVFKRTSVVIHLIKYVIYFCYRRIRTLDTGNLSKLSGGESTENGDSFESLGVVPII